MGKEIKKCTIISGSPNTSIQYVSENIDESTFIIAADSGYKTCLRVDVIPNLIIGDFDSSDYPDLDTEIIKLPCEKDDTDTFFCVKKAIELGYNYIILMCAIGNRFDHTYSNILCLDYCIKHNIYCEIVDDCNRISIIDSQKIINKDYNYFSLFAFLCDCKDVSITGSGYDVSNIDIMRYHQFAQSNYVKNDYAKVTVKKGKILLVESND